MDESTEHTNVTFDLEDRTNNNSSGDHNQSFLHHHNKDHWTDVLLASVAGTEDSGHFTASPETTGSGCSGSSRGHSPSPLVIGHGQDFSSQSSSSSTLVLEACRQKSYSMNEDQTVNLSSKIVTSARRSSSETLRLEVTKSGISINNQLACSGEGDECSSSTGHLRAALDNFNSLYKEKLTMIENMGAQGDAFSQQMMMEKKASILECWAKDVCVQNIVLIHTVEELEKQSEEKLKLLQRNIAESSKLAKKHMAVVQSYEDGIKALLNDNKASQEDKNGLQRDLDKVKAEFKRVRGKIGQLEKDNDNLVTLITRIRDMGVWDVAGLELHRRTFTHIFGLYPNLPGSEVQTVFTREKAKSIMETEEKVSKLETEIAELTNHVKCSSEALSSRDSKISQLELEYKQISEKLQTCQLECEHYKKLLIETQEKLLEATKELQVRTKAVSRPNTPSAADSARHAEIQELLHELRIVKAQLNASVNESQSAKEETTIIRREFSERLKQMQESHQCLQSEISHSFEHHHQVQEKEAELAKVKEQAELYKLKYETTEKELNNKDLIICDLQNTIKHLNEKEPLFQKSKTKTSPINNKPTNLTPSVVCCGRDHFVSPSNKAPSQITRSSGGITDQKPPWNHNFIKCNTIETGSISKCSRRTKQESTCSQATESYSAPLKSGDDSKFSSQSDKTRKTLSKSFISRTFPTASSFSLCSCGTNDLLNESILTSDAKSPNSTGTNFLTKNSDNSALKNDKILQSQSSSSENLKLPIIDFRNLKTPPATLPKTKERLTLPKIHSPLANKTSYDFLMDIVTDASNKLLNHAETTGTNNNRVSSIRVAAGYKKSHKTPVSIFNEFSMKEEKDEYKDKDIQSFSNLISQNKLSSSTFMKKENNNNNNNEAKVIKVTKVDTKQPSEEKKYDSSCTKKPDKGNSARLSSKSFEDLLAELPEQSYVNVVHDWIRNSSPAKKTKIPIRSENSAVRKANIAKNVKTNKTQLSARKPQLGPASGRSGLMISSKTNKNKKLAKEISDIKDEWNRIFSNLDSSAIENDLVDVEESLVKDVASENCTAGLLPLSDEIDNETFSTSGSLVSEDLPIMFGASNGNIIYASKKLDNNVEVLTKEFQEEKLKMKEEFKKEIRDKDIEITMQKLTIQHLQDALVALKRGQPFPVPDSSLNANGINGGGKAKVFDI